MKSIDEHSKAFRNLLDIIITLRGPDGCPWDKEQTVKSLIPNIFEETYECLDAIDNMDNENLAEEIGDLYLLVVMLSYIMEQTTNYSVVQILNTVSEKLVRRHPHVFSTTKIDSVDDVLTLWQDIKENQEGRPKEKSILDKIPKSVPPMERAYLIQKKVSKVGFDWNNVADVMAKINEEFSELQHEINNGDLNKTELEMGDLLFSVINLSRFLKINPSSALHKTNQKFSNRFKYVENELKLQCKKPEDSNLAEMDLLWEKSKKIYS